MDWLQKNIYIRGGEMNAYKLTYLYNDLEVIGLLELNKPERQSLFFFRLWASVLLYVIYVHANFLEFLCSIRPSGW